MPPYIAEFPRLKSRIPNTIIESKERQCLRSARSWKPAALRTLEATCMLVVLHG